jgi:hypothetical protein
MAIGNTKFKKALISVVLVLGALIMGFNFGKRIILIADEDVQVTLLPTGDKAIGTIPAGHGVEVLGCEDLKHYIVPKVRLWDGKDGYVLIGKFHLVRHSAWQFSTGELSFSCP